MATRSIIIVEMASPGQMPGDETWGSIDVHHLGEPEYRADLLLDHYADAEKVRGLVALGDLSLLDREITCPPGHSFDAPVNGCSIAYGRDRGEEDEDDGVAPRSFSDLTAALRTATEAFVYVYRDASWWWAFTDDAAVGPEDLRRLTRDSRSDEGPACV